MKHKLFIVEGLPCAGKSTTSKFIADLLKGRGHNVKWVDEGTGFHPADYEFHSYLTEEDLEQFSVKDKNELIKSSVKENEGYIVELNKFHGELFEKVLQYKIYDFLPWEKENKIMIDGWQKFINTAEKDTIYVFNCCFLQNPMCETMMRFGFDYEISRQYISSIWQIIKELNPIIIYLSEYNISEKIKTHSDERGREWLNSVIDYHLNGIYGKSLMMDGYDGYISCLEERQRRELKILLDINCEHLLLHNASDDWNNAYRIIGEYLEEQEI